MVETGRVGEISVAAESTEGGGLETVEDLENRAHEHDVSGDGESLGAADDECGSEFLVKKKRTAVQHMKRPPIVMPVTA